MNRPNPSIRAIQQAGFTLVELLIVVIILAILAAVVVPQFAASTDDARDSAADSTLSGLRSAIDLYYQQHNNTYPGSVTAVPSAACAGTSGAGVATGGAGATAAAAFLEQMAYYTDTSGGVCSVADAANHTQGPYLKKFELPADPYLNVSALEVVADGDLNMTASGDVGGFKYDTLTGKIIINHTAYDDK